MSFTALTRILLLPAVILIYSGSAAASFYAGALFSYTQTEFTHPQNNSMQKGNPLALQAQAGYYFNDYLGLEGRYGVGVTRSGGTSIDSLGSLLVKGNVPVSEKVAIYGLLGMSSAKLDQQDLGSETETGGSFGLGMHYALGNKTAFTFEYLNSLNTDKAKVSGLNVSYQVRF